MTDVDASMENILNSINGSKNEVLLGMVAYAVIPATWDVGEK
jgi:hypothetical protein